MAWNHPSFHLRHGGKKNTNPNAILLACPYYNWKSPSQKKAINGIQKKKKKKETMQGRRNETRQKEESIKYFPYWDKFWTKQTQRNLDKVTSCHQDNKILKMSIKQVFLPILLLLSFEIRNNCTLTFAKHQKAARVPLYPRPIFFFHPKISALAVICWCLPDEVRPCTSPGEQVY